MSESADRPLSEPIHLSGVWEMDSIAMADELLAGQRTGFVYRRDGHPNATSLEERLKRWHGADHAITTAQGMSAISAAVLALLKPGDEVLLGQPLYGKTSYLVKHELSRWGVRNRDVDAVSLEAWAESLRPNVKMVILETITNPRLSVPDLPAICQMIKGKRADVTILVDNTFATPVLCQPLLHGADLVMESLSKFVCGHGDVMLGFLAGQSSVWSRLKSIVSCYGLASSPLDCWLTTRGLATLSVRMAHASRLALSLAKMLAEHPSVVQVDYPGLERSTSHETAKRLFHGCFGNMLTIHLAGGQTAADRLIQKLRGVISFYPSLGDTQTTLSHPISTSHRSYTHDELKKIGVSSGTVRFSCGLEPVEELLSSIKVALDLP